MPTDQQAALPLNPNEIRFPPPQNSTYLCSCLIVHGGIPLVIALRRETSGRLAFDYAVLDQSETAGETTDAGSKADEDTDKAAGTKKTKSKESSAPPGNKLDSESWATPRPLDFPSEVRLVGNAVIPEFVFPRLDRAGKPTKETLRSKQDAFRSSSLCLTEDVSNFRLIYDGQ